MSRTALARYAAGLTLQPSARWSILLPALRSRPVILMQVAGGMACLGLLAVRVDSLAAGHPAFAGAGGGALVIAALTVALLAYLAYLPFAAWVVTTVLRPARPDLAWRQVLPVVGYSTLPLLAGWILRTVVAWLRPAGEVAAAGDFHRHVELLWQSVSLRADAGFLLPESWTLLAYPAQALGVFWIWHALILWGGLRELTGLSRKWAWAAVATLFGTVLVASLVAGVVATQWRGFVTWNP